MLFPAGQALLALTFIAMGGYELMSGRSFGPHYTATLLRDPGTYWFSVSVHVFCAACMIVWGVREYLETWRLKREAEEVSES